MHSNENSCENKQKISFEQYECAERIKMVHSKLRKDTRDMGVSEAWSAHLSNTDVLQQYANDMTTLSEDYWAKRNHGSRNYFCRVQWTKNTIKEYYDKRSLTNDQIKVLDVGSCHNPLAGTADLKIYPIDLHPGKCSVKKCDFLQTTVKPFEMLPCDWFQGPEVKELPSEWFHAVLFILLLEYLPHVSQRILAINLSRQLLIDNGLLIIVTPDSCHASKHSQLMRRWRMALIQLGFKLVKINKLPHLYCMAYKKSLCPLNFRMEFCPEELLKIPQDFNYDNNGDDSGSTFCHERGSNNSVILHFNELPFLT